MRILNNSDRLVTYEIRGGPLFMILSTCDLAPGDEETWDVPVPLRHLDVSCAIRVWDENHRLDKPVNTNAEVFIDLDDAGGLVLRGPDDR